MMVSRIVYRASCGLPNHLADSTKRPDRCEVKFATVPVSIIVLAACQRQVLSEHAVVHCTAGQPGSAWRAKITEEQHQRSVSTTSHLSGRPGGCPKWFRKSRDLRLGPLRRPGLHFEKINPFSRGSDFGGPKPTQGGPGRPRRCHKSTRREIPHRNSDRAYLQLHLAKKTRWF